MSYAKLRGAYHEAAINRFTASSDVSTGDVIVENGRVGVVTQADVASGDEGLAIFGTDEKGIMVPKEGVAVSRNEVAYWSAGDGYFTNSTTESDGTTSTVKKGRFVEDAAAGDAEAQVELTNE